MTVYIRRVLNAAAVASAIAIVSTNLDPSSTIIAAQQIAPEWGAAGGPIGPSCDGAADKVQRMTVGLPNQDRLIQKLEGQLDAAQKVSRAADATAREQILDAAKDEFKGVVSDYLETTGQMKKLADYMTKRGLSPAQQQKVADAVERAKASESLWKSFKAGKGTGEELLGPQRTMADDLMSVNKLFVDSGIAEEVFDALVDRLMLNPATAPAGLAAKVAKLTMDVSFTQADGTLAFEDARQVADTLNTLREQRSRMQTRISSLTTSCLQQTKTEARTENNKAVDPQKPEPPKEKGISKGRVIGAVAGGSGAGLGLLYALNELEKIEETSSTPTGGTGAGAGAGGGSSSSTPSSVGLGPFVCNAPGATNNLRTCVGSISVRAGSKMTAGTTVTAITSPNAPFHGSFTAPALGQVFTPINMTLSTGSACPPTQTTVAFYTNVNGSSFEVVSVSIPVTCR